MSASSIAITGVSGNLGVRLLPMLAGRKILGLDVRPPQDVSHTQFTFVAIDLGRETACNELVRLFREHGVDTVVHLAFVLDPLKQGVLDRDRMWQINVAGTARVMEAIAEINRVHHGGIRRVIAMSSVSVYGPELPENVTEEHPLGAHTLTYAIHKKEMDEVVRQRAETLDNCEVVLLRPHIFVGRSVQNYMAGSLKGDAYGNGWYGRRMRSKQARLPMLLPSGEGYLRKKFQFIHVDDVARLIRHILGEDEHPGLKVLNVAARGQALPLEECARVCHAQLVRLPSRWLTRMAIELAWKLGASSVPPDAFPYLCGSYTMDTSRLQQYLGPAYDEVIRHTNDSALQATFEEN